MSSVEGIFFNIKFYKTEFYICEYIHMDNAAQYKNVVQDVLPRPVGEKIIQYWDITYYVPPYAKIIPVSTEVSRR